MAATPKHLAKGSECPPLKENQLRLYSMRFCPFVRRVRLVLDTKNVPYEIVNINLNDEPEWYLKKNPSGQVPLLEWIDSASKETRAINESLVISNYLDDLYAQQRLHPADPYLKARQQLLIENFGDILSAFYKIFRQGGEESIKEFNEKLAVYEEALKDKFFGGSKPTMVDYMLWPWFELFPALKDKSFVLNSDGKLPKMAEWVKAMLADETVIKNKVPDDIIERYAQSMRQGKTDYDIE